MNIRRVEMEVIRETILSEIFKDANEIDQKIFLLHYLEGRSFSDIAAQIGIPVNSTRRRWERFRKRLGERSQAPLTGDSELPVVSWGAGEPTKGPEFRILKRAMETFGSHGDAVRWLLDDCPALNGRPIDLVGSASGVQAVENVLACIDHGIIF